MMGDFQWPACSPYLTPWDFFLRGNVEYEVYKHCLRTLEALKEEILSEIHYTVQEMLDICISLGANYKQ